MLVSRVLHRHGVSGRSSTSELSCDESSHQVFRSICPCLRRVPVYPVKRHHSTCKHTDQSCSLYSFATHSIPTMDPDFAARSIRALSAILSLEKMSTFKYESAFDISNKKWVESWKTPCCPIPNYRNQHKTTANPSSNQLCWSRWRWCIV